MDQKKLMWAIVAGALTVGLLGTGCQSGGVGDPCTPEDEYRTDFPGYSETEVNVESRSFQCETRLCLVHNFRGRVSCPYGNIDGDTCWVPGSAHMMGQDDVTVPVRPQLKARKAADTVYCSCRCDGPDPNARYCKCPSGYECSKLLDAVDKLGSKELAGSYCIKSGTQYNKAQSSGDTCSAAAMDCGSVDGL